ncbi:polysaccharide deacetylase family protein [Eubacteriales bacterium OttesenSCG-928-K08]|nr:polysaccharide deacetylase family protein [Eubacteriales bacterium OttesenSCG-928-K08]
MTYVKRKILTKLAGLAIFFAAVFIILQASRHQLATSPVAAAAQEGIELPVLLYHSILPGTSNANKYSLTPELFESDMRYLKEHGYEAVLSSDLIAYASCQGDLPQKPVLITFDDGYYNNYLYALPILESYDMKAIISIIGAPAEQFSLVEDLTPSYSYLNWEQINELRATGIIEIGNHTYHLHTQSKGRCGVNRVSGESLGAHREALFADVGGLQAAFSTHCGFEPVAFAYPFGRRDEESHEVLKELGFLVTLTSYERLNTITRDPKCLYNLGRFNRPGGKSTAEYMLNALGVP